MNDLPSVYALFEGCISVAGDMVVRSTLTHLFHLLNILIVFCFSRERNVRKHSKPGSVPVVSEKEKHIVAVVE